MRPNHRLINRAAVLAVGVLALSFPGRAAFADTVIYSTGFEPSTFTTTGGVGGAGAVNGQGGFVESLTPTNGTSTAIVENSNVISGTQSLNITRTASPSANNIYVAPQTHVSQASPFEVTAQVDVKIGTIPTGTSGNGPDFGLNLYGNGGALQIGSLVVDSSDGNIYDTANGGAVDLITDGGPPNNVGGDPVALTSNSVETLKIVANFTSGAGGTVTLQYFMGAGPNNASPTLEDTQTTTGVDVNSFDFAYLWGGTSVGTPTGDAPSGDNGTNSAIFDNYSVSTDAAVPEPTSMAVIGVAGMLLSLRRSRGNAVAGN